jgi:glycosyltransferase involved in cell wall biosynthesis
MKILQICNKVPYPPNEGGSIAMNLISEGLLNAGHNVKVLAINAKKNFIDIASLPEEYRIKTAIEAVYVDTDIKVLKAFLNLFSSRSYNVERFINKDFEKKIAELLSKEQYDIVQLETLYVCPYIELIRKYSKAPIVYRAHNVEHLIWERICRSEKNPLKRAYLKLLTKRLKSYETGILNKVDGIAAITGYDAQLISGLGSRKPVISIPVGFRLKDVPGISNDYKFPSFFHIGSMNWIPNIEGIEWFLGNVWPSFSKQYPAVSFHLAGRHMPAEFMNLENKNIINHGEVDNAHQFMQSWAVMIVPLLSGSGMRVKIIEAMACGKAVIATTIGAEGINCKDKLNILIADNPEQFMAAMEYCLSDKAKVDKIGENARSLVENEYDNGRIVSNLLEFYKKIC